MKILVCIKQVPDMEAKFAIDADGIWYSEEDLAWRMNEYDGFAVEQAVRLREQMGSAADLTVLSIGPDRVREAMKKAMAMGCDRGVHIKDNDALRRDPFEIATLIAAFASGKGFDVIFTGMQSQDRGSGQVGVLLAELLGIPAVTTVVHFEFTDGTIHVKRELEGGIKSVVRMKTPALVTCQLGLNTPRYPTLPNILQARKKELLSLEPSDLAKPEARLITEKMYFPEKKGGIVLEGEPDKVADQLLSILREKTLVLR